MPRGAEEITDQAKLGRSQCFATAVLVQYQVPLSVPQYIHCQSPLLWQVRPRVRIRRSPQPAGCCPEAIPRYGAFLVTEDVRRSGANFHWQRSEMWLVRIDGEIAS